MTKRIVTLLSISAVVAANGFVCALAADSTSRATVLTLCTLVENWKDYNRKELPVRAIFRVGAEQSVLYDPACGHGKDVIYVQFRDDVKGHYKKLERIVSKDRRNRRAWVTLQGVFLGPEPFSDDEIDQRLPAPIRKGIKKTHHKYGHQNGCDFMIDVTRVVEASEVDPAVPN